MKCHVYDIAAEESGALTILRSMYEYAYNHLENEWVFYVCNKKLLPDNKEIKVVEFPKTKSSWFYRLYFDKCIVPKLIKNENPNLVINLQNIAVKTPCKQIVYMHQSIPFIDYSFSILDGKLWIYQNVISKLIFRSMKVADEVIVQTNWVKDAILKRKLCNADKIRVVPVEQDLTMDVHYNKENDKNFYFYPANALKYKDHMTILKAFNEYKKTGKEYTIFFTLKGDENKLAQQLKQYADDNGINVQWLGRLNKQQVYEYYSKSTLIFPSYVESSPLPLTEAKHCGSPIIVSNNPWSREILCKYDNVVSFEIGDFKELCSILEQK